MNKMRIRGQIFFLTSLQVSKISKGTITLNKENVTIKQFSVFKYCGTKTVQLRMKNKYEKIDLKFISKETNKIRGKK
jgi:hypothetical protein